MGGGGMKAVLGEVLPCTAMVVVEGCIIGLTIMASTAIARGMSPYVFVVYTNALGSFILLLYSFFFHKDRSGGPFFTLPFFLRVFLLGFVGITMAQNLAFVGLSYSSPIVACGMANQIPAISFILGIILRTVKFNWRSTGSRARLIGSLISFTGAISLTLYRGPTIKTHSSPSLLMAAVVAAPPPPPPLLVFTSTHENWVLGCVLFAASSLTMVIWNIIQVGTMKMCSQVMKIISLYTFFGTVQSALLAILFLERDLTAWKLDLNFELLIIVLTAIFSSAIRSSIQIWCTKLKGPYFVPAFKPFGIPYASTFGSLLFPYTFHYGSIMGAFVCGVGYYTVLWGQIKDDEAYNKLDNNKNKNNNGKINSSTIDDVRVPLLEDQDSQV
ncbi:hypothetical protein ABFX02_05G014600 [Erythranthe guttata]